MPMHESEAPPASEIESEVAPAASLDENAAGSSPAADVSEGSSPSDEKEAQPKSLLDVVSNVVEPPKEAPEDTSTSEPEKSEADKDADGEQELSEDELAKLPFGRHPRFKKLLTERNTFKTQASEFQTRVQELEGPAGQYERIEGFLRQTRIEPQEFVELMQVGALLKNNPEEARKVLLDRLFELDRITGHSLPDDLRRDVEEGKIEEARARELSVARAREARATATAQEAETRVERVEQQTQTARTIEAIQGAVADWEARTRGSDPDFAAKDELIADRVIALNARLGPAKSPEEAVQRATQAHKEVTEHLRGMLPRRQEMRRSPESASTSHIAPAPKNLLDVVDQALKVGT